MEDSYQFIFYVIFAILYLVFSLAGSNKNKPVNKPQPQINSKSSTSGKTDVSFENFIKEITQQNQSQTGTQIKSMESASLEDSKGIETFKKERKLRALKQAQEPEFGDYAIPPIKPHEIKEMLKDPKSVRKAFIASEIFNRRF